MQKTQTIASKHDFQQVARNVWELPREFREDMRVPARLYADESLLEDALADRSIEQLVNTATLPGIVKYAIAMPDIHQGYGFPIGGVVATRVPEGVISPGGVGYDINCGVRVLASTLSVEEVRPHLDGLLTVLYRNCPSGVGVSGGFRLSHEDLDQVLREGARWALRQGYARPQDLERTEEGGCMAGADPEQVSPRAKERGRPQVGTLGAGNHFIEVDRIAAIYDGEAAERLGLFPEQVVVQIHCGSRGLGHQVCEDYVSRLQGTVREHGIELPDRELVCAPLDSPEGERYLAAMACAANFAFANRQVLTFQIRRSMEEALAGRVESFDLHQVYDIAHNMAKMEEHQVGGQSMKVCVHRKGATRAFGPGSPVLPDSLRDLGQPVLVPGSMGTASYILLGTERSMEQTFGSTCHGAGRVMSRARAKKQVRGERLREELEARGIGVRAGSLSGLAEEAPVAYKDVARVVEVVHRAGIGKKVARLEPIGVLKG
ncbi:MAG TPA: RtcB family protein [Terriglobales bacterium]|nr:RtcB family protein [Terriglobales bacterium]